jgi:glycosyltransferase involved in cell wall biosynthesis
MSARSMLVIPCFNEEQRLDREAFESLLSDPTLDLVFVDDGSTDGTPELLRGLADAHPGRIEWLGLPHNSGKAEAVRSGLLHALAKRPEPPALVGYADADLATPPVELRRLFAVLRSSDAAVLLGSRVALLGREVHRKPLRHYLGRIFATAASLALQTNVYDTQCGAKVFRASPALAAALAEPFSSRWAFDVELLGRLLTGSGDAAPVPAGDFLEEPLRQWRDVGGSKLRPHHMLAAVTDLARIGQELARRRKARTP